MTITIADLKKIRSDCDKVGAPDSFITAAEDEILIDLNYIWYKPTAEIKGVDFLTNPFSLSAILPDTQINNLVCYKTLFLFYRAIAPNVAEQDNPFVIQRDYFDKQYEKELQRIINIGIDYDWDGDGEVDDEEVLEKQKRSHLDFNLRLVRV